MQDYSRMIKEIEIIVEDACKKESNIFGYGIWTHHIVRVVENVKELAPIFKANKEILVIAALLHDYAGIRDKSLYKEHHIYSQTDAENILLNYGYPKSKIEAVKYCIYTHRGSVPMDKSTHEAECLANADAMAHIQGVPSLLFAAFNKKNLDIDKGTEWVRNKLIRSWKKLNPTVQEIIEKEYKAAILTLS